METERSERMSSQSLCLASGCVSFFAAIRLSINFMSPYVPELCFNARETVVMRRLQLLQRGSYDPRLSWIGSMYRDDDLDANNHKLRSNVSPCRSGLPNRRWRKQMKHWSEVSESLMPYTPTTRRSSSTPNPAGHHCV